MEKISYECTVSESVEIDERRVYESVEIDERRVYTSL